MSILTFSTVSSLIDAVQEANDSFDVVSFDMFDTLLIRRTHDPDLVKNATTKYIAKLAKKEGVWASFNMVEAKRNEIEAQHRAENGAKFPDHEAHYDRFMSKALKSIFGDKYSRELFQKVCDYEMQMESEFLVVREEFILLLDKLKLQGKRLFLLSDMYLSSALLRKLLEDKELDHYFEAIVSSADSFQAKASGAAYPLLEKNHSLDKSKWIHIGDNAWSDGKQADDFGIQAYVITDPQEEKRKNLASRYYFFGKKQKVWSGRHIQQLMLPLEGENVDVTPLYADGYQFFSYLFGTMLVKLKDDADKLGIKKLYFCAREGWLLKKCWEIMAPILWAADHDEYELHYLYVSRLSLAKASRANAGLSYNDVQNALRPINNRDFTDVSRVYGLNTESLLPFLEKHGLELTTDISPIGRSDETLKKLRRLCDDQEFNQEVRQQGQDSNKALCLYLEEECFLSQAQPVNSVALIDIGWVGTIQSYLAEAVSHREDKPFIQGYLMASVAARSSLYPQTQYSRIKGLLYDEGLFSSLASILNVCRDVFEEVTRASHPTLLSYQLVNGDDGESYSLEYRSEEHDSFKEELAQFEYYSDVHAGIFDGIKRFAAAVAITKYKPEYLQKWCELLILGKLGLPENAEVERLRNKYHQDDFSRQGVQRKLNKRLQKQIDLEQTVWTGLDTTVSKSWLGKRFYLSRFINNIKRR